MATITRDTTISFRGQVLSLSEGQQVGRELAFYLARTDGPIELTDDETEHLEVIAKAEQARAEAAAEAAAADEDDDEGADDSEDGDDTDPADQDGDEPPGNASREAWAKHADGLGIDVDGLGRDEIKAAVAAHQGA